MEIKTGFFSYGSTNINTYDEDYVQLITHTECIDGYACSLLFGWHFTIHDTIYVDYSKESQENMAAAISNGAANNKFSLIVIADMSVIDINILKTLCDNTERLVILDHHKNSHFSLEGETLKFDNEVLPEHIAKKINFCFDNSVSGAKLLHNALGEASTRVNKFIDLVSEYDTWKHKTPNIKIYISILWDAIKNKAPHHKILDLTEILLGDSDTKTILLKEHAEKQEYINRKVEAALLFSKDIYLVVGKDEIKITVILGEYELRAIYTDKFRGGSENVLAIVDINLKQVSLRSKLFGSAIKVANYFGGNGHPNAAGIPKDNVNKFLELLKV